MAERSQAVHDQYSARGMSALQALLENYHPRNFAIALWDGATWDPEPGQFCRFTWHINHAGALRAPLRRDRQAIQFHYDVSNDFYRLWLDPAMVYSCAYFNSVDDSLQTAQQQKLDYICRKLRLRRGQRLLDIGCGWGGLILHAAKNYGVR